MENQSNFPNSSNPEMVLTAHTKIMLYSIVLVWSLVGNVLVIAVIFGNPGLKTNFNYLIVNMAISDLLIPLLQLPMKIIEEASGMRHRWFVDGALGNGLCKLSYFIFDISPAVSIFTLVIIAANRLFAIVCPVRAQMFSRKKGWLLIFATWVVAAAFFSPYFHIFQIVKHNDLTFCVPIWSSLKNQITYFSVVILVVFLLPLLAIVILYSVMMYKVHRGSRLVKNMLNNQQARTRHRRNRQIFYISIAIVAAFVALWGPFMTFMFVINFIWQWRMPLDLETADFVLFVVMYLAYLNPCINPCIYFLFLKNYRQGLKRIFKTKRLRNTSESTLTVYMKTFPSNGRPSTSGVMNNEGPCKLTQMKSTRL